MKMNTSVKIVLAIAIVFVLYKILKSYQKTEEAFEMWSPTSSEFSQVPIDASITGDRMTPQPAGSTPKPLPQGWGMKPPSVSTDLLPRNDANPDFSLFAPKNPLDESNFLEASKLIGVDTVQSSLKNPNYSLRRDPIIEKKDNVGPFLNSTIQSDLLRRPLDC